MQRRPGEKYLSASSKKVSSEEACKQSCEDVAACRSITFFKGGWCSHFSTECKATKTDSNAISIQLNRKSTKGRPATTTTAPPATTAGKQLTWAARMKNTACNAGAGEKYLSASSKRVSNEEACKQSCENTAACRSITLYKGWLFRWCSHFSTECKATKTDSNAISIQLSRAKPASGPSKNIVQLAVGTKTLSTLVTALKAGDLVGALQGKGPFTVF